MRAMTSIIASYEGSTLLRKTYERGEVISELGSENWSSYESSV